MILNGKWSCILHGYTAGINSSCFNCCLFILVHLGFVSFHFYQMNPIIASCLFLNYSCFKLFLFICFVVLVLAIKCTECTHVDKNQLNDP